MEITDAIQVVRAEQLSCTALRRDPSAGSASPDVRHAVLLEKQTVEVGLWQHGPGVSTDVEVDEVFFVLQGWATIAVLDGPTYDIGPGDLVVLHRGAQTVWTVHRTLRKVYVTTAGDPVTAAG